MGRVAFVVPWGAVWSLPIYELALMTATYLAERGLDRVELALVTPEEEPLQLFGRAGSEAVRQLLEQRGIALQTGSRPVELIDGELRLVPEGAIAADRVVALPRLRGPGSTACRRRSRDSSPSTRTATPRNSIDVSDYGINDTSSRDKDVTAVVTVTFGLSG